MANQKYKLELTAVDKTKAVFNKVKAGLGSIKNGAMGVGKAMAGATVAIGATATAMGAIAKTSLDFADAIGKVSTRTGISVNTLQALQIATVESGGTVEGANKAFQKFTQSIGDAQRGLSTQADIFRDLGVRIEDTSGQYRGTEVILRDVIESVSNLGSESEKATVLANLFGRAGKEMFGIFEGGEAGLDTILQRVKDLGISLDEDGVRSAETLNDSMFILTKQFNNVKDNIVLSLVPAFQTVVNGLSTMFSKFVENNGGAKDFSKVLAEQVITGLADFVRGIGTVIAGFNKFMLQTKLVGLETQRFLNILNPVKFAQFSAEIKRTKEELKNVKNPLTEQADAIDNLGTTLDQTVESANSVTQGLVQIKNESINNVDALDRQNVSISSTKDNFDKFANSINETGRQLAQQNMFVQVFKDAEDAVVDFVQTGKLDFKKLIDSFIQDLIRLQIQKTLTEPLFAGFKEGGISGLFGAFGDIFKAEGGGFTGAGNRAGGLDGKGGFPAILHPNETVIDHTKGQQVGQQPLSVNFSIQATDASGFDELLTSRKNQIVAMISQAMNQKGKVGLI